MALKQSCLSIYFSPLYHRKRQLCSLHGYMSSVAGLQMYATLCQAMLYDRNISILIIVPFTVISKQSLLLHPIYSHGKYIHIKPHIALLEKEWKKLEKNAQYHLSHLKWDFFSQIYIEQSKVEHWQLLCKLGLYRQPKLDDSATTIHNCILFFKML